MSMTIKERFAEEYGLTPSQVNNLCTAAELAKSAQERYHNATPQTYQREGRKADAKIKIFEALARAIGFDAVDWPGLYPNVTKGTRRFIALPLDE
jgi:hypothetical protein